MEYVLLVAMLSFFATAFVKFYTQNVFRDGLNELPLVASKAISQQP